MKLEEYRQLIRIDTCRWCDATLPRIIGAYPHDGGWVVDGEEKKQWLSIKCHKCGYDWSLWKLGVPTDVTETQWQGCDAIFEHRGEQIRCEFVAGHDGDHGRVELGGAS